MISIVALTHNRATVLRRCVENVVQRTSEQTTEVVIWNNASTDGTQAYLDSLTDPRIRVVHHPENIALNALRHVVTLTTEPYVICLDDDVVDAPHGWDATLLDAYERLPGIGFLCASIAYDPNDSASRYLKFMREEVGAYTERKVNGVPILEGSVGPACTIIARELYDRAGGFPEDPKRPYWRNYVVFQRELRKLGYESAFLACLEVSHDGSDNYSVPPLPKIDNYHRELKQTARKNRVKRVLLAVPFAAALNRRFRWFDPPAPGYDPVAYDPRARAEPERESPEAS
jgi:GT2 family glycosyltransferase